MDPIGGRRASDEIEAVFTQIEEDRIADDKSVGRASDELLGLVDFEVLKAIDRQGGEQLERIGTFDIKVRHVVGLIE